MERRTTEDLATCSIWKSETLGDLWNTGYSLDERLMPEGVGEPTRLDEKGMGETIVDDQGAEEESKARDLEVQDCIGSHDVEGWTGLE